MFFKLTLLFSRASSAIRRSSSLTVSQQHWTAGRRQEELYCPSPEPFVHPKSPPWFTAVMTAPLATVESTATIEDPPKQSLVEELLAPELQLPRCTVPDDLEPVLAFVSKAIEEQTGATGVTPHYRGIIDNLRLQQDVPMLYRLLLALRMSGSTLRLLTSTSSKHARLVHLVLKLDPFALDDQGLVDAHLHLLLAIVSSNTVFLVPTLTALWKLLTQKTGDDTR